MTLVKSKIQLVVDVNGTGVVIPALNAEKTIGGLIQELITCGFKKEHVIVVNDGSRDRTGEIAARLGVHVVTHERNMGKGAALKDGFDAARGKNLRGVIALDADGQHSVSEIKDFLQMKSHYDLLIGLRDYTTTMPFLRRIVNKTTSLIASLLSRKYLPDVQCGFRYVNLRIFDDVMLKTDNYQTETEMAVKAVQHKFRTGFIPITTMYNSERSYIHPVIDTIRFIKMAVSFLWR